MRIVEFGMFVVKVQFALGILFSNSCLACVCVCEAPAGAAEGFDGNFYVDLENYLCA